MASCPFPATCCQVRFRANGSLTYWSTASSSDRLFIDVVSQWAGTLRKPNFQFGILPLPFIFSFSSMNRQTKAPPKDLYWCCSHSKVSTVRESCPRRILLLSPCCMHSAAAICQTCTFIWTCKRWRLNVDRMILAYGCMSLFLIRQIGGRFTAVKGLDASTSNNIT